VSFEISGHGRNIRYNFRNMGNKVKESFSNFRFISKSFLNRFNPGFSVSHDRFTFGKICARSNEINKIFKSRDNIGDIFFSNFSDSSLESININIKSRGTSISGIKIFNSFRSNQNSRNNILNIFNGIFNGEWNEILFEGSGISSPNP